MAAKRSYNKSPKASASKETWEKYRNHVKEVDKHNTQIEKDKNDRKKIQADVKKLKQKK